MNVPARQTCTTATISLVAGILSWFGMTLPAAVVAILCGHMARAEIRRSGGTLDGDGMAVAGMLLGYAHVVVAVLLVMAIIVFFGGFAAFLAWFGHNAGH